MWLPIVIISQFANAFSLFLDKFILTKKFRHPAVLTFYTALASLIGIVFIFGDFNFNPGLKVVTWSLISGALFTLALHFLYMGMKTGEATHISPLSGSVIPVFTGIFSYFVFHEVLTWMQLVAVGLLVLGAFIISFEKSRKHNGWHIGMLYAVIAGMLFALSYSLIRGVYLEASFATGFVWARFGTAGAALCFLLHPAVRKEIFHPKKTKKGEKSNWSILIVNKGLAAVYFIGMNFAISLASATLVNAMAGLQYVLLFLITAGSTWLFPKFEKEDFTRREVFMQISALILIGIGLGFLIK